MPENDGSKTFSKTFTPLSLILSIVGIFVLIGSLTVMIFAYTPIGIFFPIPDALLEKKYGTELKNLEKKLVDISSEFLIIQEYNSKLKKALGEDSVRQNFVANLSEDEKVIPAKIESEKNVAQNSNVNFSGYKFFRPKLPFSSPVGGITTREFNFSNEHLGVDFSGRIGELISSIGDGVVIFSGWNFEFGNTLIINHGDGYVSVYKHNKSLLKNTNQKVRRGESIALLGNSGNTSSGPHLHFEIWKDGVALNPQEVIFIDRVF